jgi:hypothetical protein
VSAQRATAGSGSAVTSVRVNNDDERSVLQVGHTKRVDAVRAYTRPGSNDTATESGPSIASSRSR